MLDQIGEFLRDTGYAHFVLGFMSQGAWKELVMIAVACLLLYLAIRKQYEPLLLIPIAFGMLLVNLGPTGLMSAPDGPDGVGGLLYYLYHGVKLGIYPPLIFLGIGALTDFGPLIANPRSVLLGAAAQLGIFTTFIGALLLRFSASEAASIGIIGGADGPTAIFLTSRLAPHLLGPVAVAGFSPRPKSVRL
jgi:oxaloacetate decarboxylase beta subunit